MFSFSILQEKINKFMGVSRLKKNTVKTLSRVDKQLDGKSTNTKLKYSPNRNDKITVGKKSAKLY